MPIVTLVTGGLLSALGILGFALSDPRSLTALIPLAFGTLLEVCGALALRPELKKHAMHGASVVSLLGILGSAPGAISFLRLITGGDVTRPFAVKIQAAMFIICAVFLVLCVRSFQEARARRIASS